MWRSEGVVGGEVLAKRGMEPACLPCLRPELFLPATAAASSHVTALFTSPRFVSPASVGWHPLTLPYLLCIQL